MFSSRRPEAITPKQAQGMLGRWYMPFFSGTMVHNFTLDNPKHVLKTWHVRKKTVYHCTEVQNTEFISKQLCQFLSLPFLSLQFIFSTSTVKVRDTYIPSPFFMLICFKLLITQTFFDFSKKLELLGVDCIKFTKSTNQSSWTDSGRV